MYQRGHAQAFALFWVWIPICLLGVGCQAQFSFLKDPRALSARLNGEQQTVQQPTAPADERSLEVAQAAFRAAGSAEKEASPEMGPMPARLPGPPCDKPLPGAVSADRPLPCELAKVSLPPYTIEPPDILILDAMRLTPLAPYRLEPFDVIQIEVADTLQNQPIAGLYTITAEGTINLGFSYGVIRVAGLSMEQAERAIRDQLKTVLRNPQVAMALVQFRGLQQTRGEHLVRPDGTIGLGVYGGVYVAGLTLEQARHAIEKHLCQFLAEPEISVDVSAYNSKVYYVIADGAGFGEQVFILPCTGNETVLDTIGRINGLPPVSSKKRIWVARPAPSCAGYYQILPVDWRAITRGGATETNYQIFPGDRIYIGPDGLIWFDNIIAKIVAPFERLFGITLLGNETVRSFSNRGNNQTPFFTGIGAGF